jgi:hypothetical protein
MKKTFLAIFVSVLMTTLVMASFDPDETVWSVRGDFDESDIDDFPFDENDIESAWGKFSAYVNLRESDQSQGYARVTGTDEDNMCFSFAVNWHWRGRNYEITSISDTSATTTINALARVVYNGEVTYGVPITVKVFKNSLKADVVGPDFDFDGIPIEHVYR